MEANDMSEPNFKELYARALLRGDVPEGGWPESFGVVTACDPEGTPMPPEVNATRTEGFRLELVERGLRHFRLNGYDPDSDHVEPGFGVVCGKQEALALGCEWNQIAIFWGEDGWIWLIFCEEGGEEVRLRKWGESVE